MVLCFRVLGWLEGISFLLLLLVAMPLKYLYDQPIYVKHVGMAHGVLFLGYVLLSVYVADKLKWNIKTQMLAFVASVLPFGTFIFERKYVLKDDKVS